MTPILLVAGPPFGPALWADVIPRLRHHGLAPRALDLWDPVPEDATVADLAGRVAAAARALGPEVVVVAHGTAVPLARLAAARAPVAGLVLSNGPLDRLDPVTVALARAARAPRLLAASLLRPGAWLRWLASSAGLRRAVVNPYVMDRDTVVALAGPLVRTAAGRRALARFLADLGAALPVASPAAVPTLLLWGNEDPLYPSHVADSARRALVRPDWLEVPGGRHLHPVERPWFLADAVADWQAVERSPGPMPADHDMDVTNSA